MAEKLLTTLDAAAILGCSPAHVRWLIRAGKLPRRALGRDYFLTRAEVDRYRPAHPAGRPRGKTKEKPAAWRNSFIL